MAQQPMLEDKVVIVTGGGGGVGRAYVLAAAAAGAKVVINDIGVSLTGEGGSQSPAEETLAMVRELGGEGVINTDSVSDWDSARRIVDCAQDHFGRLDAVVNNAGVLRDVMFHKMSLEEWQLVVDVHLNGTFYVSRAAAEIFRKQHSGAYIHTVSTSGLIGNFGQANYSAAKLGIAALSKSIALDMQRYGVRSNCIAPFAWSRMTSSIPARTDEEKARVEKLKQMTPDKNAPLVVFLASDQAQDISGQIFSVRNNEIFTMGQSRPLKSVHRGEGWTPETVADHAIPALKSTFYPLERSGDVFSWDPI
ncbi:Short chain dehydrogenase/reductase family oxidoreductase [Alloalcanivorax dieselolei B5]|jgi:NAD(P)-dependent dehydrogenase (short-subunit alcohol dehydrogenase family)|uniref:Short chain dehydrogenase/reductase family oxidoreductase n=1 Tax=Alcanivorax dieselolei (strain DSM 16502 / CGMCC 1.3690 / MCCC 1A00001 / B-5) TaxID=930169 RepID=K0CE65_ALCDB|nr:MULTISPECIES: SDR family NAD(P)-dependent oxidoreductase [Alloalcanivorax]MBA4721646.1 SDR family oxidoreductase [Alcanivorax sp.]AFT69957.1 Short chain dehydrogenase/reductase family oxidoreductase [Alloalcanivorax dieselolei B5]PHS72121.1 MAG: 3-hydroxyacyl-CoA dehydrogenase [Alcanivorax sp.]CUR48378.1 Dehydrogenases with different specificities (related to short-chain alcohol dehydrogenases) [Alloalcanivorax xenomutans]SOC22775.1 NAD(P)-dependent dehydrogenase (short-subunit alcohol dehy